MAWQIKIYGSDLSSLAKEFGDRHVKTNELHGFIVVASLTQEEECKLECRGYRVTKGMNFSLDVGERRS